MFNRFDTSRRSLLSGAAALPFIGSAAHALIRPPKTARSDLQLRYDRPAARWEEALPVGNGRFGAMLFGRVAQERLQLNEDTLWAGSPYTPDNPDARAALAKVRRLINEGRFKQAEQLASERMMAKPLSQMPYGTLGDLLFDFDSPQAPHDYERTLDLESATATIWFSTPLGTISREVFASAPGQLIAVRMTATGGQRIGFVLSY